MTDVFFSYSSVDRERVRPIRDALVAQGFEVFWDQEVPTGLDWDSWIRQHLAKSKCAMAFWSTASVSSDNVRHEAMVAKQQGKLISVLLDPLTIQQFPMGLYAQQAANLAEWDGDPNHNEWRKFRREFEAKLTPSWVRRQIDQLEAELVGERARREGAEHRDSVLQAQITKEAKTQQELKRERNEARDELAALKASVEELTRARSESEARQAEVQQGLARERDSAVSQVTALSATVDEVTRARSDAEQRLSKVRQIKAKEIVRSVSPFVIAAAVATVGIWTYQLVRPAPQSVPAVLNDSTTEAEREQAAIREEQLRQAAADTRAKLEAAEAEQQRLKDELQNQIKAAADADLKRRAAEAELQRQAEAAAEAETRLRAAQAEQQRQTKAATDADGKRKAAEAEQQRLKEEVQRQAKAAADGALTAAVPSVRFERRSNTVGSGIPFQSTQESSIEQCEAKCRSSAQCALFSFGHVLKVCGFYSSTNSISLQNWESGVRN
jgi:TIR domain/PAN domain